METHYPCHNSEHSFGRFPIQSETPYVMWSVRHCHLPTIHVLDHQISNILWWHEMEFDRYVSFPLCCVSTFPTSSTSCVNSPVITSLFHQSCCAETLKSVMRSNGLKTVFLDAHWILLVTAFHWVVSWGHIHLGLLQSVSLICFLLEIMRRPSNQYDQLLTH